MIMSFKTFLKEGQSLTEINQKLDRYTSGAAEEYDNTGAFEGLFDPNGEGLPKILSQFGYDIIGPDGDIFKGKGVVISPTMSFKLARTNEFNPVNTLTVEISKVTNGDYIIKSAKVS